jgi:hypothetical protein
MRLRAGGLGFAVLLAGCGGGGDGGAPAGAAPGPVPAPVPYSLTFSPSSLNLTASAGTGYLMSVDARIDRPIPEAVNVAIIDRSGVLRPSIQIVAMSPTAYSATLYTESTLTEGTRTGTFEVRICRDDPLTCASPIPGSPWLLPFNFTITPPPTPPAPPPALPPPPPAPPPPPPVGATFAPASIALTAYQDELQPIAVVATLSGAISQVYPRFEDPSGVFQPNPPTVNSPGNSSTTLYFSTSLAAGTYNGNVHLRLCMDLPCTSEYPNSPALLPYVISVLPASNLTPLTPLAGATDWSTFQGNPGHTGHVPVTLDPARFNRRWKWTVPASEPAAGGGITPVVTANDRLYFVISGYFRSSAAYALNEVDRTLAWKYDFGSVFAANAPAVSGTRVFLATSGHADTFMWSFDALNGNTTSKVPFSSQWEHYYAPTIVDGSVYSNGGTYGGLLSFRASDGAQNWFNSTLPQYDSWTPAVDTTYAFAQLDGKLFAVDRATGITSYSISDPDWNFGSYSHNSAPMLGSANTVIGINSRFTQPNNRLINFDTASRAIRWSIPGRFLSEPAVANGTVYVANGTQLEARRESDGALAWSWTPSETTPAPFETGLPPGNIIVTNNLVLVSTQTNVYAIDIATRAKVWSFPRGGRIAISRNGILYISPLVQTPTVEQAVTAINLR